MKGHAGAPGNPEDIAPGLEVTAVRQEDDEVSGF